jgi:hypothetical protein
MNEVKREMIDFNNSSNPGTDLNESFIAMAAKKLEIDHHHLA